MPGMNGTGPWGQGPGSGWGRGPCGGGRGYGQGYGQGFGQGFGRGRGAGGGFGRGFGRGMGGFAGPPDMSDMADMPIPDAAPAPDLQETMAALDERLRRLEDKLDALNG